MKKILIGNENYSDKVGTGLSFVNKLDYELDVGIITIPFSNQKQPIPMWTKITFTDDDEEIISFRVGHDEVELASRNPLIYNHTITLIEHTKYLEFFIVTGKTFTQPVNPNVAPLTMYDVVTDLLETTPLREYGEINAKAFISPQIVNILQTTIANEHTFKDQTLRECLDEVVSALDAIVRLDGNGYITLNFFNETKNLISNQLNKFNGLDLRQDINNYATSVESSVLNAITDDKQEHKVSYFPSKHAYATARSTDTIFNFDNGYLGTPYPIYEVQELEIPCRITTLIIETQYDSDNNRVGGVADQPLYTDEFEEDVLVGDRVLERNAYKTLENTLIRQNISDAQMSNANNFFQENTVVYDYGKRNIDISNTFGLFGTRIALENALRASLLKQIRGYNISGFIIPDNLVYNGQTLYYETNETGDVYITVSIFIDASNFSKGYIPYRISYTPIPKDVRQSVDRDFIEEVDIDTTMLVNQSTRLVDMSSFKENARGRVNKMGNSELELKHRVKNISEAYDVGDYTEDNYIVTQREFIVFRDFYQVNYSLSKNFNKLSQFVGINSEERQWEIAEDGRTLERDLLYKNYVNVYPTETSQNNINNGNLNTLGKEAVIRTLTMNNPNDLFPDFIDVVTNTSQGEYGPFILPLNREGGGNSLSFSFRFDNNASVGKRISGESISTWIEEQNLPISPFERAVNDFTKYTDDFGRIDGMIIRAFNTVNQYSSYLGKVINGRLVPLKGHSYETPTQDLLFSYNFDVRKDSRETLKGTLSYQFTPDNREVILGKEFCDGSPFLIDKERQLKFRVYNNPIPIKTRQKVPQDYEELVLENLTYNENFSEGWVQITNAEVSDYDYWAITDQDDNLIIGFNNARNKRYINFEITKRRKGVKYNLDLEAPAVINFTLSFNSNGGSIVDDINVPATPVVVDSNSTEYFFEQMEFRIDLDGVEGWNDNDILQALETQKPSYYQDLIDGSWDSRNTIRWGLDEFNIPPSYYKILYQGTQIPKPTNPTREGFVFVNWFNDDISFEEPFNFNIDRIFQDTTLHAKWDEIVGDVTVTFDSQGGTDVNPQNFPAGETATEPTPPTKFGFEFDGWYIDEETTNAYNFGFPVFNSIVLYAKWVGSNTVTFYDDDLTTILDVQFVGNGEDAVPPQSNPPEGYELDFWDGNFTDVQQDEDVFAVYKLIEKTITYVLNGGTGLASETFNINDLPVDLQVPTRVGYTFEGWYENPELTIGIVLQHNELEDKTFYAKWDDDLEWEYIGTSGTENGTYDAGSSNTDTCRTSGTIQSTLTNNRTPNDYTLNFIMKVTHTRTVTEPVVGEEPCTDYYYQAVRKSE